MRVLSCLVCVILVAGMQMFHCAQGKQVGIEGLRPFVSGPKCNLTEFEQHFGSLTRTSKKKMKFPENTKDLADFCKQTMNSMQKIESFKGNNCYSETMNKFIPVFIYSIRIQVRRYCSKRQSKRTLQLISAASCLNRNEPQLDQCMLKMNNQLMATHDVDNRYKVAYVCCGFVHLVECVTTLLSGTDCEAKLPIITDLMVRISGNMVESYCGEYNLETDKCSRLPKLSSSKRNSKSFILNLGLLFESINSNDNDN